MINFEQIFNKGINDLLISYYNSEGKISGVKIKIPESELFVWKHCERNEEMKYAVPDKVSQEGKRVRKQKTRYLDKYRKIEFIMNLPQSIKDKIFSYNIPQKWFFDIETEIVGGNLNINDATDDPKGAILSIVFCDEHNNIYIQGTKKLTEIQKEKITKMINDYFVYIF